MTSLYGKGDYGVGAYSSATNIPFGARGAGAVFGRARAQVLPTFRRSAASATFGGRARVVATLHAGAFTAAGAGLGAFTVDLWAVSRFPPAWSRAGGAMWLVLDPGADETLYLPLATYSGAGRTHWRLDMRAVGWRGAATAASAARAQVLVPARRYRAAGTGRGLFRPILVQTLDLEHAGSRYGAPLVRFPATVRIGVHRAAGGRSGAFWSTDLWAQARAKGSGDFGGRIGPRMLFASRFPVAAMAYAGRIHLSYTWSNLTAPGREPAAPWAGPGIPGGAWAPAPTPTDPWSPVLPAANPWISEPAPASGWTDPE